MAIDISTLKTKTIGTTLKTSNDTYKDLSDTFEFVSNSTGTELYGESKSKDLSTDVDYKAISNSLQNIFNTSPGEKILNPAFGADLKRYLFEPVDETTAEIIGNVVVKAIKLYEPRVTLKNVEIIAQPDQNQYTLNIDIEIPALKSGKQFTYSGVLTDTGVSTSTY